MNRTAAVIKNTKSDNKAMYNYADHIYNFLELTGGKITDCMEGLWLV